MSSGSENFNAKSANKQPNVEEAQNESSTLAIGTPVQRPIFPHRKRRTIKLDGVNPRDFAKYDVRFFCDDCSHYSASTHVCTMGYVPQHTKRAQLALYDLTGKMAFCRFLEID
jgi:hypothetical protein